MSQNLKYSHQLSYTLLSENIEELSLTFYGSSLEMQELELVITGKFPAQNQYQQEVKFFIENLFSAYTGELTYETEVNYNQKLREKEKENKEEEHFL